MGIYLWKRKYQTRLKAPLPEGKHQVTGDQGRVEIFTVLPGGRIVHSSYGLVSVVELSFEPSSQGSTVRAFIRPGFLLFLISFFFSIPVLFITRLFFISSDVVYETNHNFFVFLFFVIFIVVTLFFSLFLLNNGKRLLESLESSWADVKNGSKLKPLGAESRFIHARPLEFTDISSVPTGCPFQVKELDQGGHELIIPRKDFTAKTALKTIGLVLAVPGFMSLFWLGALFLILLFSSLFKPEQSFDWTGMHNAFNNVMPLVILFSISVYAFFFLIFASDYLFKARIKVVGGSLSVVSPRLFGEKECSYDLDEVGTWRLLGTRDQYQLYSPVAGEEGDICINLPAYASPYADWALKLIEAWMKKEEG